MVRMMCAVFVLLLGSVSNAGAIGKGASMLALELTTGTADLSEFATDGSFFVYDVPEVGVQAQYWRLLSDDYAWTLSVGWGASRQNVTSSPTFTEETVKHSSFNVRLGGDRVVEVGSRALMYGGPGVEYWVGKSQFGGFTSTRLGLSARLGATMKINETFGITAHVGPRIGWAKSDSDLEPTKASWWTGSFEGTMGVAFAFGSH
jgi:hypothetical protein